MRRTLILLAGLLAGIGGQWSAGEIGSAVAPAFGPVAASTSPVAPGSVAAGSDEIVAAEGPAATAFVRPGSTVLSIAWQESTGPAPRPLTRRAVATAGTNEIGITGAAMQAMLRARTAAHRTFGSPLALERAGRASSSTTTPPPFRSV